MRICTLPEVNMAGFDTDKIKNELETRGYSVVTGVVPIEDCDECIKEFRAWFDKFGKEAIIRKSLIHQYKLSHSGAAWRLRLRAKPVFEAIWGTEKLLSSTDGVSIGEPPEQGHTQFSKPEDCWFHIDQGSWRLGLHVYQGAVYMEETTTEDHCFRVMEGSTHFHRELLETFPEARRDRTEDRDFYILKEEHKKFYLDKGCKEKKVPVPKGGMVLWDSRTVHDNITPVEGRQHGDRWRYVSLVCMAPAIWTTDKDLEIKNQAYKEMRSSAHWPSQGVWLFPSTEQCELTKNHTNMEMIEEQPEIARTREVKLLAGIEKYDFDDGRPNGPDWEPKWSKDRKTPSTPEFAKSS